MNQKNQMNQKNSFSDTVYKEFFKNVDLKDEHLNVLVLGSPVQLGTPVRLALPVRLPIFLFIETARIGKIFIKMKNYNRKIDFSTSNEDNEGVVNPYGVSRKLDEIENEVYLKLREISNSLFNGKKLPNKTIYDITLEVLVKFVYENRTPIN